MTKLVAAGSAGVLVLVLIIWCFSGLTYATEGERVVLVDDLLATGGTSAAAAALIRNAGANLVEAQFLIELEFLEGRKRLEPTPVTAFLKY